MERRHEGPRERDGAGSQNDTTKKVKSGLTKREETILKLWSGLSESNRHLNLGKVPYYHYTKAA